MSLFIKYLSIGVILVFNGITQTSSSDFDPAFASNGYSSDYGYQRDLDTKGKQDSYLFIGHRYWVIELDFDQPIDCFSSKSSEESDWFGTEYRAAFDYEVVDKTSGNNSLRNMTVLLKVFTIMFKSFCDFKSVTESRH